MLSNGPEKGMFVKKKKIKQKMKKEEVNNFKYLIELRLYFSHRPLSKSQDGNGIVIRRYTTGLILRRHIFYHICAHLKMLTKCV